MGSPARRRAADPHQAAERRRLAGRVAGRLPGAAADRAGLGSRVEPGRHWGFAHNGVYYSAPAFVCFYTLDNEKRVYDDQHRIQIIDYTDPATQNNYVDPLLDLRKDWRDEYRYATDGALLGWTRTRGERSEEFTSAGDLILEKDADGKTTKTGAVRYVAAPGPDGTQVLKQEMVEGAAAPAK